MATGSGLDAQIGVAPESTWGTAVTPVRFLEFVSESLNMTPEWLEPASLRAGQKHKRVKRVRQSRRSVGGDIVVEHATLGMGLLWKHALGSPLTTPTQIAATTAYEQYHYPGDYKGLGLTVQVGRPEPGSGTVKAFCVDEQTEILTRRGWLGHRALTDEDEALAFNPQTREVRWEPVLSVHRFDWDGPLVRWQSTKMDALTTPNHRWLVEDGRRYDRDMRRTVYDNQPAFQTTEQLAEGPARWIVTGGGTPACFATAPVYSDEFVELIGWVITEGHYCRESAGVKISQSEGVNAAHCARLRHLAKHYRADGHTVTEYGYDYSDGRLHWYFGASLGRTVRHVAPDRQLTPEFLAALTVDQARTLYRTLLDGDGHRTASRGTGARRGAPQPTAYFAQKDPGRVDGFQMLCAMLGHRTHARPGEGASTVSVYRDDHCISSTMPTREEDYRGIVWCPRTPSKTWLARRNGVTYWTGNTYSGCKVVSWEFSLRDQETPQLSLTLDGKDEDVATPLTAASYLAGASVFDFSQATLRFGGTATRNAGVTTVAGGVAAATIINEITIAGEAPMATERFGLGNAGLKSEQIENDIPTITGSLGAEFNRAELYDAFSQNTTQAIELELVGGVIGASAQNDRLVITLPACKMKGASPQVGGPDIITMSTDFEAYHDEVNPPIQVRIVSAGTTL